MTKTLRLIISFAAVASMMIVAYGTTAQAKSKGTIAVILSGPDLYYKYGADGAEQAAKALGYNYKVYTNPNVSATQELANVEDAINAGSVAITGYSVGLSTEDASLAKAKAAHVPIFLMYGYDHKYLSNTDVVGFEQVDLVSYAFATGTYAKAHFKGTQLAVITGQLGRGDAEGYQQGFLQGLGCKNVAVFPKTQSFPIKCGKITVVDSQSGGWLRPTAYAKAQALLSKYPSLGGMFVENDDMAVGVHTAAVQAGKKNFFMVSDNGAPYGLAGIKAGWLAADDTCSPALEGINSVRLLNAYMAHKVKADKLYYSYKVFVTKATVNKAVGWTIAETNSSGKLLHPKAFAKQMSSALPKPVKNPPM